LVFSFITNRILNEDIDTRLVVEDPYRLDKIKNVSRNILANHFMNFFDNTYIGGTTINLKTLFSIDYDLNRGETDNLRRFYHDNLMFPELFRIQDGILQDPQQLKFENLAGGFFRLGINLNNQNKLGTKFALYLFLAQIYIFGGIARSLDVINHARGILALIPLPI
jgi:hypothetical protein